ncbi:MAG TPA: ABC transporter substrate-binding protein [Candidatus Acidoferrales bacterium]|nr:ABC transporter substrate-binding protein [Candidatus Acidoferrales bacterium]
MTTFSRSHALRSIAALAATAVSARPAGSQSLATVTIGITNSTTDTPFIIAEKLGYFRAVGINAQLTPFDGAPKMIAPLGTGQLDVGSGAPSAGLYNAVVRGIDIRMVADKGTPQPGYGYDPLLVRKDLVTSGKFKTPRDLKGMKVAEVAVGGATSAMIARLMESVGLTYNDVQHVYLPFPDHVAALANGSIDAAFTNEPYATIAERQGTTVRVLGNDKWYPGQQIGVVIYGSSFLQKRRDVGTSFMIAWIRAARFYNDALAGGHLRGRTAKEVLDILAATTEVKDRTIYSDMVASAVDPNGKLNISSLADDLAFFKRLGLINGNVIVAQAVDTSFQEAAVRKLGPYSARR